MKQLYLDYTPFCTRVAFVDSGQLVEFAVERASVRGIVGNIYKGKVENVLSGMKAAFVNIGLERNGFLYMGDTLVDSNRLQGKLPETPLNLSSGDIIMCQVVKDQFGTKGARLTTDISLPGYYLVLLPNSSFIGISRKIENVERREYLEQLVKSINLPNTGFIIRSAADKASDSDILSEASKLQSMWENIQEEYKKSNEKTLIFEDATLFERAIRDTFSEDVDKVVVNDKMVADALKGKVGKASIEVYSGERNIMSNFNLTNKINHICDRKIDLENGAYLVVDKTEALTVIDVNTGKFVGDKDLEDTVFKTNLAAAEAIAKHLRLRNISGIVVIDFIDMVVEEHQEAVIEKLKEELKKDRLKTTTVGMTALGLVELTRKKTSLPLDDFMLQPCKHCNGGYVVSDEQLAFMLRDSLMDFLAGRKAKEVYVGVRQDVYDVVFESNILKSQIENAWKDKKIYFYILNDIARDHFEMSFEKPNGDKIQIKQLEIIKEHDE